MRLTDDNDNSYIEDRRADTEGGGGGGGFGGIGLGFPLIFSGAPSASGPVVSTARIRLPDRPSYAANWRASQLRIELGAPPAGAKTITLPAPMPPAS